MKENFIHFMKRFRKLDDIGFRVFQIDMLQFGNFMQYFSTNLEKLENMNF